MRHPDFSHPARSEAALQAVAPQVSRLEHLPSQRPDDVAADDEEQICAENVGRAQKKRCERRRVVKLRLDIGEKRRATEEDDVEGENGDTRHDETTTPWILGRHRPSEQHEAQPRRIGAREPAEMRAHESDTNARSGVSDEVVHHELPRPKRWRTIEPHEQRQHDDQHCETRHSELRQAGRVEIAHHHPVDAGERCPYRVADREGPTKSELRCGALFDARFFLGGERHTRSGARETIHRRLERRDRVCRWRR